MQSLAPMDGGFLGWTTAVNGRTKPSFPAKIDESQLAPNSDFCHLKRRRNTAEATQEVEKIIRA